MLMRIVDILVRNIIFDDKPKEEYAKLRNGPTDNLSLIESAIMSCVVTFSTWTNKSGDLDWTSLSGNDMKKALFNLPDKILLFLHEDTIELVKSVWKTFGDLSKHITKAAESLRKSAYSLRPNISSNFFLRLVQKNAKGTCRKHAHIAVPRANVCIQTR